MKKELIAYRDPKSPISEIFRTLRTNIQFMNTDKKLKALLITSTSPSEGKSWVSSNLAVTFAQAGKRVILVDADMRKGRQYSIFGVSPKPGLSNYLSGIDEYNNEESVVNVTNYIQKTKINNLCVMSAGNVPPNPSELLVSAKMIHLLDELKELADIVIIDGTPCELVTDSVILSRIVDSTIIVTAYAETKKDALKKILTSIENVGGKVAGVVINKIPIVGKKYKESYYYGSTKDITSVRVNHSKKTVFGKKKKKKKDKKRRSEMEDKAMELYKQRIEKQSEEELEEEIEEELENMEETATETVETAENVNDNAENFEDTENNESIENNENIETTQAPQEEEVDERTNDILKQINDYLTKEKNS